MTHFVEFRIVILVHWEYIQRQPEWNRGCSNHESSERQIGTAKQGDSETKLNEFVMRAGTGG
ncbi:hypothetical protein ASPCADRAFT_208433 [Aspergillus carbonarius ITEM 5010]|uniref:Uncharacterized protein n=1 Tax=Aspergillus carbonarius (strain ITEM 5010) TaxID=602072 RepID=A0A1R3RJV4_ASPC5|nr:hypothetical protein ASPCADRAFT_208433 [Aspergillus carbonarius ITEM 5010]